MAILTTAAFMSLVATCAPTVHPKTMYSIVKTESSLNPYAIGVVDKPLQRQPQSLPEALGIVDELIKADRNFSIGLGQINRYNFDVNKAAQVFEPCNNLSMAAQQLVACAKQIKQKGDSQQQTVLKAVSCYYSGNPDRGFKLEPEFNNTSHVQRVLASAETYQVGAIETANSEASVPTAPVQTGPALQPVYQSWDVLRQYPRYVPVQSTQPAQPTPAPDTQQHQQPATQNEMESSNE
jgi:type IV secretion system protein VirB1